MSFRAVILWLLLITGAGSSFTSISGSSLPTREEVLQSVYPDASIVPERVFLTQEQLAQVKKIAQTEVESALWALYRLNRNGEQIGRAYVDTHVIRTKRESLLICLDQAGHVKRIEATAFLEPPEYQAPDLWLGQFEELSLSEELRLQRLIRPLTGATLTASAVSQAVRRVLAIDRVIHSGGEVTP